MYKPTQSKWLIATLLTIIFFSCSKDDIPDNNTVPQNEGLYILSEGAIGHNNTTLGFYDFVTQKIEGNIFRNANKEDLGDTGNDMLIYGSKMYIVMNVSDKVTVIDKWSAKKIKDINPSSGKAWSPRYAIAHDGKVYVSAYDKTISIIDTTNLSITKTFDVGENPEGLTVSGDKLFVCNSGNYDNNYADGSISVIDLNSQQEIKKLSTGPNPQKLVTDSKGFVYNLIWGNYDDIPAKVYKIDPTSLTVVSSSGDLPVYGKMAIYNDQLFLNNNPDTPVITLNTTLLNAAYATFITDGTKLEVPYGINIDEKTGDVYVTDAVDFATAPPGKVYCFDPTGKLKFSIEVPQSVYPNGVAFLRK